MRKSNLQLVPDSIRLDDYLECSAIIDFDSDDVKRMAHRLSAESDVSMGTGSATPRRISSRRCSDAQVFPPAFATSGWRTLTPPPASSCTD